MIQGVREVFEIVDIEDKDKDEKQEGGEERRGKVVLIGRGLEREEVERSLGYSLNGGLREGSLG